MTLSERIASEIMDTIERERRINKDDLVAAAERVMQKHFDGVVGRALDKWEKELDERAARIERGEEAIVEILPSYFRPKPAPTRFGTET